MFDFSKLRGLIREKGLTQHDVAAAIGITDNAFSLKLKCKSYFTVKEIADICDFLDIAAEDIASYFFCKLGLEN